MRGGQTWSIDVVIGVLVFLLVLGVFYALLMNNAQTDTTELKIASETIAEKLTSDTETGIVSGEAIDQEKLRAFAMEEYARLKQELGVNTEFCVFFEDENGNVVNITFNDTSTFPDGEMVTAVGIGSDSISVANISCLEVK